MITISTRGRYATRIMVQLAAQPEGRSLSKYELAVAEGITPAYVQQLMMALRLAGLVTSHRGREGGFSLARSADTITMADILKAVEGDLMALPCRTTEQCERAEDCPTRPVWEKAAQLLDQLFTDTTIAALAQSEAPAGAGTTS